MGLFATLIRFTVLLALLFLCAAGSLVGCGSRESVVVPPRDVAPEISAAEQAEFDREMQAAIAEPG